MGEQTAQACAIAWFRQVVRFNRMRGLALSLLAHRLTQPH
jgi:hypothetical protein